MEMNNTAEYVFKGILAKMYSQYKKLGKRRPDFLDCYPTFDSYLWDNLDDFGLYAYNFIGEYFGDADQAAADLGLE
jgi:hypothetical protein